MKPLHLLVRALDSGNPGTPVVTQYTDGHPCAGAAHSYKPILVSREDSLTWARKGSLCNLVSLQPKGDLGQVGALLSPCKLPAPHHQRRRK